MTLEGKRTLIIGGAGDGIGRAITRSFGAAGARIAIADLDTRSARAAAAEWERRTLAIDVDVRSSDGLESMVHEAVAWLGGLDVVVTVVGGQVAFVPAVPLHEITDQDWDTIYELNLRYVARTLRLVIPEFLSQGSGGTVISIGSVTGSMAAPGQAAYGVMKAGLASLARTVAAEYSNKQIRMNVIAGGAIATGASGNTQGDDWVEAIPQGRFGNATEVASAALYLAGDESSYVTGQQLTVDGGVSVRGPFS